MILAYDGTTSLASLVSSTSLKIKMVLKDCSRAYSSEYVTSVNIVVPEPPTFATDMPATFTAVSGSDKTWTLPSINQGDLGFDDPIVISTSDPSKSSLFSITQGTPHTLNFSGTGAPVHSGTISLTLSNSKNISKQYDVPYEVTAAAMESGGSAEEATGGSESSTGVSEEGSGDGGTDAGVTDAAGGGTDAGDGSTDAGSGGVDTDADTGTEGGTDGGTQGGTDTGTDGGTDTGTDTGTEGGTDTGTDGGTDTGTDAEGGIADEGTGETSESSSTETSS